MFDKYDCPHGEDYELLFLEESLQMLDCCGDEAWAVRAREDLRAREREIIDKEFARN